VLKTFSGRSASQNEFELRSFIEFLRKSDVNSYLEIGARHGDTFHEVMINLPAGSYGMAVDMPGALWGKKSSVDSLQKAVADLRVRGYTIDVIIGDSTAPKIIEKVKSKAPFGAALIDGDHTLIGVKKDWDNYKEVSHIIAFHDIVGAGQIEKVHGNLVEVPQFWSKLKATQKDVIEFVDKDSLMGIGVCLLP
jgi:hypothetical protein